MSASELAPEDDEPQYDLAGNLLPAASKRPAAAMTPPPPGYAPPPQTAAPAYALPAERHGPGPLLFIALGAAVLVLIGVGFGVKGLLPKPAVVPTVYKTYTAIDGSFSCDQPAGWTVRETGANSGSLATAAFTSGPARVRVVSDAAGSLMSDAMSSPNSNLPPEQQVAPVEKLHKLDEKQLADTLPGYSESAMQTLQTGVGDSRVSEWTAGGQHGYRVTMLGHEREFTVICLCPEANWVSLQPAFQRIIGSVKQGNPT